VDAIIAWFEALHDTKMISPHQRLWPLALLVPCVITIPHVLVAGSPDVSSSSSSSLSGQTWEMDDLRQLDNYGESIAIRHATVAADRGRTVAVLSVSNNNNNNNNNDPLDTSRSCLYICTPLATGGMEDDSSSPLLQRIALDETCYLVASGVTGDAKYFVSELQTYATRIRHEYGVLAHWEQRIIPYIMRRCFHHSYYDESKAWNPPVIDDYEQQEPQNKLPYSRPLGIRAVICSYENNNSWRALSMDPSGTLLPITDHNKDICCFVMGKDAKHIRERLLALKNKAADQSTETLLQLAFEGRPLRLEILRSDGSLERRTIPGIRSTED
jgi:hypothetical protein